MYYANNCFNILWNKTGAAKLSLFAKLFYVAKITFLLTKSTESETLFNICIAFAVTYYVWYDEKHRHG